MRGRGRDGGRRGSRQGCRERVWWGPWGGSEDGYPCGEEVIVSWGVSLEWAFLTEGLPGRDRVGRTAENVPNLIFPQSPSAVLLRGDHCCSLGLCSPGG